MQDIIKEYGPALITVVAVISLVTLVSFLIGSDGESVVGQAFSGLIQSFFQNASQAGGIIVE